MVEAQPDGDEIDDELVDAFMAPGDEHGTLVRREAGRNVFDHTGSAETFRRLPPHRKVLAMIFLLAMKDAAREVHFEPWKYDGAEDGIEIGVRIFFRPSPDRAPSRTGAPDIDGMYQDAADEPQELVPPPRSLSAPIFREIEAMADLNTPRRRLAHGLRRLVSRLDGQPVPPRRGGFVLRLDEHEIEVEVTAYPSEIGPRLFLKLTG